ncbi:MAG: hypothetical protein CMO80_16320 [Verrucomicrobiales bacterium]|nr:hypothetical protein [Verrucomicrobiales bacterium]
MNPINQPSIPEPSQAPSEKAKPARRVEKILARSFLSLLVLVGALGALECVARLWLFLIASPAQFAFYATVDEVAARRKLPGPMYMGHRYLGYALARNWTDGTNRHNAHGFRGEDVEASKPADAFRIACLGGSTTYSTGVKEPKDSYPARLENHLQSAGFNHVEVINAGTGGYTTWESLVNLQFRVIELDPDLVIIHHGVNDVHPRLVWPRSSYRADNSGYRVWREETAIGACLVRSSILLRCLSIRLGWIDSPAGLRQTFDRKSVDNHSRAFTAQHRAGNYPSGVFANTDATEMLTSNPPVFFRQNLLNMAAICRANRILPIFSSFTHCSAFTDNPRASSPEYTAALAEQNEMAAAIAKELSIPFYDFAEDFPTNQVLFTDGIHLNELGTDLKGKLFAKFLIEQKLIPPVKALKNSSTK